MFRFDVRKNWRQEFYVSRVATLDGFVFSDLEDAEKHLSYHAGCAVPLRALRWDEQNTASVYDSAGRFLGSLCSVGDRHV